MGVSIDTILRSMKSLDEYYYYGLTKAGHVDFITATTAERSIIANNPNLGYSYVVYWKIEDERTLYRCLFDLMCPDKIVDPDALEGLLEAYGIEQEDVLAYGLSKLKMMI